MSLIQKSAGSPTPFLSNRLKNTLTEGSSVQEIVVLKQETSARQGSEWGMRALKAIFSREGSRTT